MFGEVDPIAIFLIFLGLFIFGMFLYFISSVMGDMGLSKDDSLDKWEDHLLDRAMGFTKKKKK